MTREIIICQAHAPYPGNYTCVATNSLGAARQEIRVSGKPLAPSLVPGARGASSAEYIVR